MRSGIQKGISQKVKPGASLVERTMLAVDVQMTRTSEDYMPIYPNIPVLIAVKLMCAFLSLTMYVAINPTI